jgi:tRNA (guanine-N7-)-methyltransferase
MFSDSVLHYARLAWPTAWPDLFGREAPLILELGFGGGDFLVDLAQRRSEANVIGLEISLPALRRGARKSKTAGVQNVRIVQGESRSAVWLLFRPASISGVTVNFPDPWPKAAHQHRRIIQDEFLDLLATRMLPGAPLDIVTDHAEYAAAIHEILGRTPYFNSRLAQAAVTEDNGRLRTKYERIAIAEGRTCHYFKWQRNDTPAPDIFPILEETPVPHMVLLSTLSLDEIGERFTPFEAQVDNLRFRYLDIYRSLQHKMLLIETYVSEEPFHQRVGLAIRQRKEGDLVVSLQEVGFPRPTPGMHVAIDTLVNWLRELDPGLTVVSNTLSLAQVDEDFE